MLPLFDLNIATFSAFGCSHVSEIDVSASTIIDENKSNAPSVPLPVSAVSATPNNTSSLIS